MSFRSKFDKIQNWAAFSSISKKTSKKAKANKFGTDPNMVKQGDFMVVNSPLAKGFKAEGFVKTNGDDFNAEARKSIEVCENVGLIFNVEKEVLLNKFRELEDQVEI
ncbi:hypothetical protein V6N13_051927 [Hibiscus sabdariffa]